MTLVFYVMVWWFHTIGKSKSSYTAPRGKLLSQLSVPFQYKKLIETTYTKEIDNYDIIIIIRIIILIIIT